MKVCEIGGPARQQPTDKRGHSSASASAQFTFERPHCIPHARAMVHPDRGRSARLCGSGTAFAACHLRLTRAFGYTVSSCHPQMVTMISFTCVVLYPSNRRIERNTGFISQHSARSLYPTDTAVRKEYNVLPVTQPGPDGIVNAYSRLGAHLIRMCMNVPGVSLSLTHALFGTHGSTSPPQLSIFAVRKPTTIGKHGCEPIIWGGACTMSHISFRVRENVRCSADAGRPKDK